MKLILFALGVLLAPSFSYAYLTSDVDFALGYSNIGFKTVGSTSTEIDSTLTTMGALDATYSLNNAAWNAALILSVSEALSSNQGSLAWTRVGVGGRYYVTGFNSQRVIFDNKVEGTYYRPAPFVGMTVGISNFSIRDLGTTTSGYFNASCVDIDLRGGAEVVLTDHLFLTGQWSILYGLPTTSVLPPVSLSYFGTAILVGLKITPY